MLWGLYLAYHPLCPLPHFGKGAVPTLSPSSRQAKSSGKAENQKAERQRLKGIKAFSNSSSDSPVSEKPPLPPIGWEARGFSKGWSLFPEFPRLLSRPRLHLTCVRFPPCTIQPVAYFARRLALPTTPEGRGR